MAARPRGLRAVVEVCIAILVVCAVALVMLLAGCVVQSDCSGGCSGKVDMPAADAASAPVRGWMR